jgi:hypothetical protein
MAKFTKKIDITEADANATADVAAGAPTKVRVAPVLTTISNAVPIPAVKNNRGSKGAYPFDNLEIGQSFGVANRNAKQMASIVSNANKRFLVNKTDENGNVVFKTTKASDGNGGFVTVPTSEPEKVASRRFIVLNVDPATDPDQASVRIWREA